MLTLTFASGDPPPDPTSGREVSVWRDDTGAVCARTYAAQGLRWIDWPAFGVYAFEPGSRDVRVWAAPSVSPNDVTAIFERVLQPVILQALGWQALHASAVLGRRGVLALCGHSGSGKSTLAYALREAGFAQFADDGVVIALESDRVLACALPFAPRLRPASFERFSSGLRLPPGSPAKGSRPSHAPLAGVVVLHQDAAHSGSPRCRAVDPAQAFTALLTHAHCFDVDSSATTTSLVHDYLAIAERVPAFELTYAPGLDALPEIIGILSDVAETCGAGAPALGHSQSG